MDINPSNLYGLSSNKSKIYRDIYPNLESSYASNKVQLSQFNYLNLLPMTIYLEFLQLPYFWFLFVIILEMAFSSNDFSIRYYNLISFSILFTLSLAQNLASLLNTLKIERRFNERKVQRWKNKNFETCLAKDLRLGYDL